MIRFITIVGLDSGFNVSTGIAHISKKLVISGLSNFQLEMLIGSLLQFLKSTSAELSHQSLAVDESIVITTSVIHNPGLTLSKALTLSLEKSCKLAKKTRINTGTYEDQNNKILKIFDSIA